MAAVIELSAYERLGFSVSCRKISLWQGSCSSSNVTAAAGPVAFGSERESAVEIPENRPLGHASIFPQAADVHRSDDAPRNPLLIQLREGCSCLAYPLLFDLDGVAVEGMHLVLV